MVDEITDRNWIILDAVDGRVHYADLGRLPAEAMPRRGTIGALAAGGLARRPNPVPRLQVLSYAPIERLPLYDGPTWLDEIIVSEWRPEPGMPGFSAELANALAARGRLLAGQGLARLSGAGDIAAGPEMLARLRKFELRRLSSELATDLKATFMPRASGESVRGIYVRAVETPSGRLAVIQNQGTFTLAPWKPALEPLRDLAVTGAFARGRVVWTRDKGRALPGRG